MNRVWVGDNYVNLCDVLNAMDNSIVRELENDNRLYARLYASDQQFVNAYVDRHREKYEEEFEIGGNE